MQNPILLIAGSLAGFIDAIAGGGGLITLPVLTIVLGNSVDAIGTNKIVGTTGALIAFLVYFKKNGLQLKSGSYFLPAIIAGSLIGSFTTPHIASNILRWITILIAPLVLLLVLAKPLNVAQPRKKSHALGLLGAGVVSGLYDGMIGPGGGTLMLIALLLFASVPLFEALTLSKLANVFSAGTALAVFSHGGHVHPRQGFLVALGMGIGAFVGAKANIKNAQKIFRPVLVFVVGLLCLKLGYDSFH